jgi:hypothetical protein
VWVRAENGAADADPQASVYGGVILTSRRGEYRSAVADAADVLTAAAVIGPLALSGREAAAFLRTHRPQTQMRRGTSCWTPWRRAARRT